MSKIEIIQSILLTIENLPLFRTFFYSSQLNLLNCCSVHIEMNRN